MSKPRIYMRMLSKRQQKKFLKDMQGQRVGEIRRSKH